MSQAAAPSIHPTRVTALRCEYLFAPINIDVARPRLSWIMESSERGEKQTAYRILVASSAEKLAADDADLWDTGKVDSDQSSQIHYAGEPLASRQQCFWKVMLWDKVGVALPWSEPATWTIALLDQKDWTAKWVSHDHPSNARWAADLPKAEWVWYPDDASSEGGPTGNRYFRKTVTIPTGKPIAQARCVISADNEFTAYANGNRIGVGNRWKAFHELGFTKDAQAAAERDGTITFAIEATRSESTAADSGLTGLFRVDFQDGTILPVVIDRSWTASDAKAEGWETTSFVETPQAWQPATVIGPLAIQLWGMIGVPPTPMPIFRKEFEASKPIRRATAYVCGLGQFDLSLNGQRVGGDLLQPGWTNYRKTCQYVAFDLTDQIRRGPNAIGVMLGNGMYNVVGGRYVKFRDSFGPAKLIAQLHLDYADGSSEVIVSDERWTSVDGPIVFNCIYGGEDYDARIEQPGWDAAGFDDGKWRPVVPVPGPGGALVGSSGSGPPIRVMDTLPTSAIAEPTPGVFVYDTTQNASQFPRITVKGPAGSKVRLTPGELLTPEGLVAQKTTGSPSYYEYTLKGGAPETWSPRFFYYGARYYQVDGAVPADRSDSDGDNPILLDLTGQFVTSSAEKAGSFACSNELFTRTATLIDWAIRSNLMSVLTDCPHREKLGWLEQVHLMGPSLMFNYDLAGAMTKTCSDMADAQTETGLVPDIAPEYVRFKDGFRDSPEWGSACILVPWQLYQWYGDVEVLRTHYGVMTRYVAYLASKSKGHIVDHGLGDWYDLGPNPPGYAQLTPVSLTATAFYYEDLVVLGKIAALLGKNDDAARFVSLARDVADAFNASLYDASRHSYATGSQAANAIPLVFGIAPEEDRPAIVEAIVKDVRERENSLTAGDVGYRYLLRALGDAGRSDVIYDMNSRSDRPGYGYILNQEATALTEAWDARPSSSHNHFMLGHIMQWFYADLAGIRPDPGAPGFKRFEVKPSVVGDIAWTKASYRSIAGMIESAWTRDGGVTTLEVTIPANTSAVVYVPAAEPKRVHESGQPAHRVEGVEFLRAEGGYAVFAVQSGRYQFRSR